MFATESHKNLLFDLSITMEELFVNRRKGFVMQELDFYGLGENSRRIDSNEDENPRDFGGILEQAGLMSDSLLSVQGLSQGMLISCGNLERSALDCVETRASPG